MSTTMLDRVYVDFNTMMLDEHERVSIHPSTVRPSFRPGLRLVLYDEELEVEAELDGNDGRGWWLARPDWSTRRALPADAGRSR
jgi:hypothetical protein